MFVRPLHHPNSLVPKRASKAGPRTTKAVSPSTDKSPREGCRPRNGRLTGLHYAAIRKADGGIRDALLPWRITELHRALYSLIPPNDSL